MARILQTDASLWKEEKTLSFCPTPSVWDSVWTGRLADGSLPTFVLLDTYSEEYSACTLVLCREGQGKGIHLPTLHMLFPHLDPWDGSTGHAVLLLATLLRYRRVYDPSSHLGKTHLHITQEPPRPLILITEYEKESFEKNTKNPHINKIITKKAKTFADIFAVIATLPKSYVVFTRKGIVLDDMRDVWSIPMKKTLLSLLSYEIPSSGNLEDATLPPISDVQDTWIIRSEDVPQGYFSFPIEQTKSESVFAYRMLQERFLVVNPARSLKTWRLLPSIPTPPVSSPVYHFIHPTGINEMKPLLTGSRKMSLTKTVEGTDAVRWVHMLSKKGIAESLGQSTYTYTKQEGFSIKDCFQTMTGLAFDSTTMYIGSGKGAQEAWSNESLYALLPTQAYESGTIVHFPEEYMARELCVLHVISRLLMHNEGVYLCPESCRSLFSVFGLKGIPPLPDTHFVYKKAFCYPVDGVSPEMIQALRKSIDWIPEPIPFDGRLSIVCVHCSLEEQLRGAWDVRRLDDTMSVESIIANLRGAWGIILGPSAKSSWNWILPLGARVFELSSMDTQAHDLSTVAGLRHIFTTEARLIECIADTP